LTARFGRFSTSEELFKPYPLAEVSRQLAGHHGALQRAVEAYPLAMAIDADGRPDKLGAELAELVSFRELSATHLRARRLRDRARS